MEATHNEKTTKPYSSEFRERAARLATKHRDAYLSDAALLIVTAGKLVCSPDRLRVWASRAQRDGGERAGQCGPNACISVFCPGGVRPPIS